VNEQLPLYLGTSGGSFGAGKARDVEDILEMNELKNRQEGLL
jgi:hypothetical protein